MAGVVWMGCMSVVGYVGVLCWVDGMGAVAVVCNCLCVDGLCCC